MYLSSKAKLRAKTDGNRRELFSVGAGDDISSSLDLDSTGRFYIIVETDGNCRNGDLRFEIE